jgi:hypothetical protein
MQDFTAKLLRFNILAGFDADQSPQTADSKDFRGFDTTIFTPDLEP